MGRRAVTRRWWKRVLSTIADRGREWLKLPSSSDGVEAMGPLCHRLLVNRGEASGIALARDILERYAKLSRDQHEIFFHRLATEFNPEPSALRSAIDVYLDNPDPINLTSLVAAVEPPRQALFRALNMAPGGTVALVQMRGDLLGLLSANALLKVVDADLKHLLASWFNRGFLYLERIDWHSPADILEKLISYESVHAIEDWDDLRRRLANDRSCYAFFHPAMPDEPLIFVEVALVQGMADAVQPLLDKNRPVLDARRADSAIFYSINNTHTGLRGISFGNFLIKQVLAEIQREFPQIKLSATLSPLPRFRRTLESCLAGEIPELPEQFLDTLLEPNRKALCEEAGVVSPFRAMLKLLEAQATPSEAVLASLERVALAYLTTASRGHLLDPVANFHLTNGARLERINVNGDVSAQGKLASYGVMVNYVYDSDEIEANHERFVNDANIALSRPLSRVWRELDAVRSSLRREVAS